MQFGGSCARQRKELLRRAEERVKKLIAVVRNEKLKVDSRAHKDESSLEGSVYLVLVM